MSFGIPFAHGWRPEERDWKEPGVSEAGCWGRRLRSAAHERLRRGPGPGEALCWDAVPLGHGELLRRGIFRQRDSLETAARGGLSILAMQEDLATTIKECGDLTARLDALRADTEASRAGVAKWTSAKAGTADGAEGEERR